MIAIKNRCSGVRAESPLLQPLAKQLAIQLKLPSLDPDQPVESDTLYLQYQPDGLHIIWENRGKPLGFQIDFTSGLYRRRLQTGGKNQGLAKAIGIKGNHMPTVLDATAGFARDSFTLASLGCEVTLLERSPILAAMLAEAIDRASYDHEIADIIARMTLHSIDAEEYLHYLASNNQPKPDVVYLDPMFPERRKKALVKKEMQILHQLLGNDDHQPYPLELAMTVATHRVVVKRPRQAEDLNEKKPSFRVIGKSSRYDVYLTEISD
ncbi:MAG: class I SAM-dependent methyltransferase [Pseudomonadales bacterium]|nr:class I SAM-dependent methyltransferase [Pseudomonadales bacterium]